MELDITQLQWLLTGIGVLVVVLIYVWVMRSRIKQGIRNRRRRPEREPALGETAAPFAEEARAHDFGELGYITADHHLADRALVDVEIRAIHRERQTAPPPEVEEADAESEPDSPVRPTSAMPLQMTVALTVMAPPHHPFSGERIKTVAEELSFLLGENDLFEHYSEDDPNPQTPVFSIAHLREPGSFDVRTMADLITPGLLLFMNLPGPLEGTKALNVLVLTADQLAQRLGGVICDGQCNRMTNQMLMQLREEVSDLEQRRRVWAQSL